jgi:hypothetical protein
MTIRAGLLVGLETTALVLAYAGWALIMLAISDQVFLEPLGLEILPD